MRQFALSDQLFVGSVIRILTVVDSTMPKGPSNYPEANFRAARIGTVLDRLVQPKGKPKNLRVDNRPEFAARLPNHSAYLNGVETDFSRPGTSMDNEFNARLRMQCRNVSWFLFLTGVRARSKNGGATTTSIGPSQI